MSIEDQGPIRNAISVTAQGIGSIIRSALNGLRPHSCALATLQSDELHKKVVKRLMADNGLNRRDAEQFAKFCMYLEEIIKLEKKKDFKRNAKRLF